MDGLSLALMFHTISVGAGRLGNTASATRSHTHTHKHAGWRDGERRQKMTRRSVTCLFKLCALFFLWLLFVYPEGGRVVSCAEMLWLHI